MLLLVHTNVAAGEEEIAVLDGLVDAWELFFKISTWRFHCIERIKRLAQLHEAIEVVLLFKKLAALSILALGSGKFAMNDIFAGQLFIAPSVATDERVADIDLLALVLIRVTLVIGLSACRKDIDSIKI